jgi:hypothetical protein
MYTIQYQCYLQERAQAQEGYCKKVDCPLKSFHMRGGLLDSGFLGIDN